MEDKGGHLLRWAPPALSKPEVVRLGGGSTSTRLAADRDYVVQLPPGRKVGATVIEGGRNVVVRGGHLTVSREASSDKQRRAIYIKGAAGIVHLEGLLIDSSGGAMSDGIVITAPAAVVQIENVRVEGLSGTRDGFHADVVQPWGGVRELRIDRLTGSSSYQGLQIPPDLGPIGSASIERVNLTGLGPAAGGGGHLLWLTRGADSCASYAVSLREVYLTPQPGRRLADSVWPSVNSGLPCAVREHAGMGVWPGLPVTGGVLAGAPPSGDFVPVGTVGTGYRPPGYRK